MKSIQVFATRLKEVRLQTGKNQKEFADMVQSTAATISAYENATKNPSLEIVISIAEKCNVSIDWLSGLSDKRELNPKAKNCKDVMLMILELLTYGFELKKKVVMPDSPNERIEAELLFPSYPFEDGQKFLEIIGTYKELHDLYERNQLKQNVIDTWLMGALEELGKIPVGALNLRF